MENYIAPTISVATVFIGWFVILNGAKHIATRGEIKGLLDSIRDLLNDNRSLFVTYWMGYDYDSASENRTYFKHSLYHINTLKTYLLILEKYNVTALSYSWIRDMNRFLTETPTREIRSDSAALKIFIDKKIHSGNEHVNSLIKDLYHEHYEKFKPTITPIISRLYLPVLVIIGLFSAWYVYASYITTP